MFWCITTSMNVGMKLFKQLFVLISLAAVLQGCNTLAYTNSPLIEDSPSSTERAGFELHADRGKHDKTLFVLALSGGGSRAAYWSASSMLKLQKLYQDQGLDILSEVDAISAISGGSMVAAYYAISADGVNDPYFETTEGKRPVWDDSVKQEVTQNFLARWFGNWFWPHNFLRFWFTAYDRTDIMAETLSDNLYDTHSGHDFTLGEINPHRPNLILNATISSGEDYARGFTYTKEDFHHYLCSSIDDYELSRAVMSSASFPAAFNSMTLRSYGQPDQQGRCAEANESEEKAYLHTIDGGTFDNLGLHSGIRFLHQNDRDYERIVVILIDAYVRPTGLSTTDPNPRSALDYIVDTNFMDSVNALMDRNRSKVLGDMWSYAFRNVAQGKQVIFYHATFESIDDESLREQGGAQSLKQALFDIPTSLSIDQAGKEAIDEAVDQIFVPDNLCLQKIAGLLTGEAVLEFDADFYNPYCLWTPPLSL